ncbi:MAG: hypothetical protein AB7D07_16010 [Desulfovibrionaceae bacterium]
MSKNKNSRHLLSRKPKGGGRLAQREAPTKSHLERHPKFSLRLIQSGYCVQNCDKEQRALFADTLRRLSGLTWKDIMGSDRHGLGFEKIDRLNVPTPAAAANEKIISFRCFGMAPMVGFRREATFYVLWLDPGFTVYDH